MKKILFSILILLFATIVRAQEKRLLPHLFILGSDTIKFVYDEQNRFTDIEFHTWNNFHVDEFVYFLDKYEVIKNKERYLVVKYQKQTSSKIIRTQSDNFYDDIEKTIESNLNAWGKVTKQTLIINNQRKGKTSYSYRFLYDTKGNVTSLSFSKSNTSLLYLFNKANIKYDDKNGIFRNLNLTPIEYIYDGDNLFFYFLFLSNNVISINNIPVEYIYNDEGYPISMRTRCYFLPNDLQITYIEAN